MLTAGSNRYSYDANGNMLTRVEVSGTQRITYTHSWDAENQLVVVTNTASVPNAVTRFVYDGDGNRVWQVQTSGTQVMTTAYASALEVSITATQRMTKTYYSAGAQLIALRLYTSPTSTVLYFLHSDHLGSTTLTTDSSGNGVARQSYDAWGNVRLRGDLKTDIGYTAQREDRGTNLMFYRARYYSPGIMRFISADTIVPDPKNPQSLNRYSYVNNRPLNFTDPTGNFSEDEIKKFFDKENWEEVLKLFQEGGLLAGRWGWLETLRRAEVGDYVDIHWDTNLLPEGHPAVGDRFRGWFTKDNEGQLLIGNKELGYYCDGACSPGSPDRDSPRVWRRYDRGSMYGGAYVRWIWWRGICLRTRT